MRVRQALFRPPFLGPFPGGASGAVPKEGCLVAQSPSVCCGITGAAENKRNQWDISCTYDHQLNMLLFLLLFVSIF